APWCEEEWTAVDDRVRGGKSRSHMTIDKDSLQARFFGHLEITFQQSGSCGGAGFASQSYMKPIHAPELHYCGILLLVKHDVSAPEREFHLVLKTTLPRRRPDGWRESNITYERSFSPPHEGKSMHIVFPWDCFYPSYRGSPAPDAPPLDPAEIKELTIMCRSGFGKQHGDFSLFICKVGLVTTHKTGFVKVVDKIVGAIRRLFTCGVNV
ncbi:NADH:ubiquinone oxidoreductase complex I intermediate-associated protein 30, partial [Fistulina hepatica ATCC 64428]